MTNVHLIILSLSLKHSRKIRNKRIHHRLYTDKLEGNGNWQSLILRRKANKPTKIKFLMTTLMLVYITCISMWHMRSVTSVISSLSLYLFSRSSKAGFWCVGWHKYMWSRVRVHLHMNQSGQIPFYFFNTLLVTAIWI